MDDSAQGPLTLAQMQAIWLGAVDAAYSAPYVQAGDGNGYEVYNQGFAQYARVSEAVDRSFQSMFVLPWSGQTNPSAQGAQNAVAVLTVSRSGRMADALVLSAVWVDEIATDAGPSGPFGVNTGRRYLLQAPVVFFPGEQGPFEASAVAEKPGYGYNNPQPGTLSYVEQPGTGRANDLATVTVSVSAVPPASPTPPQAVVLVGDDEPDMFTPDQIGQYVGFTGGANSGASGRIVNFLAPTSTAGSAVYLEQLVCVALSAAGSFVVNGSPVEILSGATVLASGVVYAARTGPGGAYCVAIALSTGSAASLAPGCTLSQPIAPSGTATGTVSFVFTRGTFSAEAPSGVPLSGGASWEVLDWSDDWGLAVTNAAQPTGGRIGMLDALGAEKNLPRLPGEGDAAYAARQSSIADVVTPNAIKRALVRDVGSSGWCFREVGSALLPGFFLDRPSDDPNGDAYDYGSLLFTGTYAGTFQRGEVCTYLRGINALAEGYWGCTSTPLPTANPSGYCPATYSAEVVAPLLGTSSFALVLSKRRFDVPTPAFPYQGGDVIVGSRSGAVFTVGGAVANPFADSMRWHCLLDYEQFRAFFIAGVPSKDLGDYGFTWDQGGTCFYDAGPAWLNFFDGYPVGDVSYYLRIFNDVERTRAGGVGWQMVRMNGTPCQ